MASQHLPNHLRRYRKQAALSQDEIAFLLGRQSGAKVSRYEHFRREPGLRTALAYVAILRAPVTDLFPGLYQQVAAEVRMQAVKLAKRLKRGRANQIVSRKLQSLAAILEAEAC